ncbi:F-box only protein 28 [Coccinella septempunctata]|uniref:F-box only protein 28 n=1 Tax=Coccinella septempunctata TaxID=41139 RepID=UPI001D07B945|nr:F-box only protein 28 [Coccinella septempunctata]
MVSTRQMTTGGDESTSFGPARYTRSGSGSGDESSGPSTSRYTRNSSTAAVASSSGSQSRPVTHSRNLLDLPQEILEKILKHLSFKNICQVRLVCRRFDAVCAHILNSTFLRLQNQTLQRFQEIKSKMPRRESARRTHHLACESDIIETLHMRLTLMQMSFGKHIERKHCCFFPGEILDEVYHILHYIKVTPKLHRPYKVTDELFDLSTMAMEYFKEKIEPDLPEIAYFGSEFFNFSSSFPASSPHPLDASPMGPEQSKDISHSSHDELDVESEVKPQANMVLRKRIRIIKQGMKRYNSQLSLLRQDLKACKRKTAEQEKQINDQQKQLAEQQQQTLEYAARLDEYDKKNEEVSRKFSTLLQELNKCKTELQYWRSKSPAIPPFCTGCGNPITYHQEELKALVNQGVDPQGLGLEPLSDMAAMKVEESFECKSEIEPELEEILKPVKTKTTTDTPPQSDQTSSTGNLDSALSSGPKRMKRKLNDSDGSNNAQSGVKGKKTMRRRSKVRGKRLYNL